MTNFYVNRFKEIIVKYYNEAGRVEKQINRNNKELNADYRKSANAPLLEKKETLYAQAKEAIGVVYDELCRCLGNASFPNVEDLTADRLLFSNETPIELTQEQVKIFVERYKDNFTMLSVISGYIEKNHNGFDEWISIKNRINTPEKQIREYQKIANSALSLINTVHQNPFTAEMFINDFCNNENASFWSTIGNGMKLLDYKNARVPESASHLFDDYKISATTSNGFDNLKTVR